MEPELLINPVVKWAVHPADQGRIRYVDGLASPQTLPKEGDVITRPFLVHPSTGQPLRVRVSEIRKLWTGSQHVLAVVVTLDQ